MSLADNASHKADTYGQPFDASVVKARVLIYNYQHPRYQFMPVFAVSGLFERMKSMLSPIPFIHPGDGSLHSLVRGDFIKLFSDPGRHSL